MGGRHFHLATALASRPMAETY